MRARPFALLAAACFFTTGATSLIYQVVWSRYLTLTFGAAHYSVATVVAAYMLGLGLGGWLIGRIADRTREPAKLYARLELVIAGYGLLSPLIIGAIQTGFVAFSRAVEPGPLLATAVKAALALLALALPTVLMGGTLPVLARALVSEDGKRVAVDVGRLYALNTLGAVAGSALAGFWMVEHLGLFRSLVAGAVLNALAGVAILAARPGAAPSPPLAEALPIRHLLAATSARFALVAALVTGFASLADEIVWTRLLSLLTGSSTYAYTIILATFLLGIALGARVGARLAPESPYRALAWAQMLAAAGAALLLFLFEPATVFVLGAAQNPLFGWRSLLFLRGLVVVAAVLPATIGFGASFPALVALASRESRSAGSAVGLLYGANTLGAIFGSLAAGFFLIPWLGTPGVLRAAVFASLGIAAGSLLLDRTRLRLVPAGALLTLVVLILATPPWPRHLLDIGAAIYFRNQVATRGELELVLGRGRRETIFLEEGPTATVTVRDVGTSRTLRVNGKSDASSSADMSTQIMSGVAPLLAHPEARRALVIGVGSGVTASVVAHTPGIEQVEVAEIEPAVVRASELFSSVNHDVWRNPKVKLLSEDGRNHLLTTARSYDVIISEPSNPWMAGTANLFTREYYRLVEARLAPGGVFCQWVQSYGLTEETFRRILATVLASFPQVEMWHGAAPDTLLVAAREPIVIDLGRVEQVFQALDTAHAGELEAALEVESPLDLLASHVLGSAALRAYVGAARPFSDDPPALEFMALRDLYAPSQWSLRIREALLAHADSADGGGPVTRPPLPAASRVHARGRMRLSLGDPAGALALFEQAARLRPAPEHQRWIASAHARTGNEAGREAALRLALQSGPDPRSAARLGAIAVTAGRLAEAREMLALAAGGGGPEASLLEAEIAAADGLVDAALRALEPARQSTLARIAPARVYERAEGIWRELARTPAGLERVASELATLAAENPRFVALRSIRAELLAEHGRCEQALEDDIWLGEQGLREGPALWRRARCEIAVGDTDAARATLAIGQRFLPWDPELARLEQLLRERAAASQ